MLGSHKISPWLLSFPGVGQGAALKWRLAPENVGMTLSQDASQHHLQGRKQERHRKKRRKAQQAGARGPNGGLFA